MRGLTNQENESLSRLKLTPDEWHFVVSMRKVLYPVWRVTKLLQGELFVTGSWTVFLFEDLKLQFDKSDKTLRTIFNESVERTKFTSLHPMADETRKRLISYISDMKFSEDEIIAIVFHQHLKSFLYPQIEPYKTEALKLAKKEYRKYSQAKLNAATTTVPANSSVPDAVPSVSNTMEIDDSFAYLMSLSSKKANDASIATSLCEGFVDELEIWLNEYPSILSVEFPRCVSEAGGDPLWLVTHFDPFELLSSDDFGSRLPIIQKMGYRYISSPSSASFNERSFNDATEMSNGKRSKTNATTISRRVRLKHSIHLLMDEDDLPRAAKKSRVERELGIGDGIRLKLRKLRKQVVRQESKTKKMKDNMERAQQGREDEVENRMEEEVEVVVDEEEEEAEVEYFDFAVGEE